MSPVELIPSKEETSTQGLVHWSCYDYVPTGKFLVNRQEEKKIAFIRKETSPHRLFKNFKQPTRQPSTHACVHEYSKGYVCRQQDETQTEYFYVISVSLHVTILHRHATEATDGVTSTRVPIMTKELGRESAFLMQGKQNTGAKKKCRKRNGFW